MAQISGAPFRGMAKIHLDGVDGDRHYTVATENINPSSEPTDLGTWQKNPGNSFSLLLEWDTTGLPTYGQANSFRVETRLPNGAAIGSAWTGTISGTSGSAIHTMHLDDDPLNETLGTARSGMLELYIFVERTDLGTWSADSRGGGSPPTTHDWAEGYVRSTSQLASFSLSNVSSGGAEPASWAFDDKIYWTASIDAQSYNAGLNLTLNIEDDTTETTYQSITDSTASGVDYAAQSNGDGSRIDNSYPASSSVLDIELEWQSLAFGGDTQMVWRSDGTHTGGPTYESERILSEVSRMTVDPRITIDHHMQINDNSFATPPGSLDENSKQRLTADLAFVGFRLTNARGEGINNVTSTELLEDASSLVSPGINRSVATQTQGGEDGWVASWATWDSALPGGAWNHTIEFTTSYATGLEVNDSDEYVLLAKNPNFIVVCGGGHDQASEAGLHWRVGNELLVGATLFDIAADKSIAVDDSSDLDPGGQAYPRAYTIIARFNLSTGTAQYYDQDGTWKNVKDNPGAVYEWQMISIKRSNELQGNGSIGDDHTYVVTVDAADTENWGLADLFFVPIVYRSGTPYSIWGITGAIGPANTHTGYAVDAVSLALHGVLGTR